MHTWNREEIGLVQRLPGCIWSVEDQRISASWTEIQNETSPWNFSEETRYTVQCIYNELQVTYSCHTKKRAPYFHHIG